MSPRSALAAEHLSLRLRPLNRALRAAVERQAADAGLLDRPDLTPYCITDEQVLRLMDRVERFTAGVTASSAGIELSGQEQSSERTLRQLAAAAGMTLPLDELEIELGLVAAEQSALLLCAAPELDLGFERIYAYILDDLSRRVPCVELMCTLLATSAIEHLLLLHTFGPAGRLRRFGLLRPWGEAPTELRQELRCAPAVVAFLSGAPVNLSVIAHDPGLIADSPDEIASPHVNADQVDRLGRAVRDGALDLVGVWGPRSAGPDETARAVARAAGTALRQVPAAALGGPDAAAAVGSALRIAAMLDAMLWIPVDRLTANPQREAVAEVLARTRTPVCLSGLEPWRPFEVLSRRAYAEICIEAPGYRDRRTMWSAALPALEPARAEELAARYRLSGDELRTVGALANAAGQVAGDPQGGSLNGALERAVAAVTHRMGDGLARPVVPRRTVQDLVLPEVQRRQVAEMTAACLAWPKITEAWDFGRQSTSGIKTLFTGDPGTGKTLAAEVIAGTLGLLLLKVDLARVVSKWIGETEKNLEAAFQQAENSQAVLFFDEADALFGKRGEIKQGIDRYANLEVGFLLQRLEQSDAIVILASNLREHINPAFSRRFHYVIHFPRPGREERERIWRLAFPPGAPLADDADLSSVAQLDMTGASITGAARSAALLAADATSHVITMFHVVQGVRRQYDRDARLLRPEDLGEYACLVEGDAGGQ